MPVVLSLLVPVWRPFPQHFWRLLGSITGLPPGLPVEACLCDDASDDPETVNTLSMAAGDPRLRVVSNPTSLGPNAAAHRALSVASGEFVAFVEQDDAVVTEGIVRLLDAIDAHADADVLYTDEDRVDLAGTVSSRDRKPGWSPYLLLGAPYLGRLVVVRRSLLEEVGGIGSSFPEDGGYDLMLRCTEAARRVVQVPEVAYRWSWTALPTGGEPSQLPWAHAPMRSSLRAALSRRGIDAAVESGPFACSFRVAFPEPVDASVAEIVLELRGDDWEGAYRSVNDAAVSSSADFLCVRHQGVSWHPGSSESLTELACRPGVGAVGGRVLGASGELLHSGIAVSGEGAAWVPGDLEGSSPADHRWAGLVHECSAVSSALMVTRASEFRAVGGFDPALGALADVDYCLRLGAAGRSVLFTPQASARLSGARPERDSRGASRSAFAERWSGYSEAFVRISP